MNMLKIIGATFSGLLVGAIIAAWAIQAIERSPREFMAVATEERMLSDNVMLLKVLDEGKPDIAKSILASKIQASLDAMPETLTHATDLRMHGLLDKTSTMARLALSDRSKSYAQLQKEAAK